LNYVKLFICERHFFFFLSRVRHSKRENEELSRDLDRVKGWSW